MAVFCRQSASSRLMIFSLLLCLVKMAWARIGMETRLSMESFRSRHRLLRRMAVPLGENRLRMRHYAAVRQLLLAFSASSRLSSSRSLWARATSIAGRSTFAPAA
jgi:hypothetical protein